jgi:hypothetical protein
MQAEHGDRFVDESMLGPKHMFDPYEQVTKAFEGFVSPTELKHPRGGIERIGKKPLGSAIPQHNKDQFSPHYHVEMSFTEEQRSYVVTVLSLMGTLATGKVLGHPEISTPSLAERIEENYKRRVGNGRFYAAVLKSDLDLLEEFKDRYGNLKPAVDALLRVAGAEGMSTAISNCTDFAYDAELLQSTEEQLINHDKLTDRTNFVIAHPLNLGPIDFSLKYEVWCSGEAFAKTLISQAAKAGVSLAKGTHLLDGFPPQTGIEGFDDSIITAIRMKVKHLVEDASLAYAKGEIA